MGLRRQAGKKVWIFQMEVNGKTWSRSTGQTNKKFAEREIPRLKKLADSFRNKPKSAASKLSEAITAEVKRLKVDVS